MTTLREILRERIRAQLKTDLSPLGLDPDSVYINGVNNLEERMVIDSSSLTEDALDRRLHNSEYPNGVTYSSATAGIFSKAYTFEDEHRITSLTLENAAAYVTACLNIPE
ncbi:hypothetical protein AQS70_02665 [Pseudomonas endophytica]|uniref:Uncharacterized protein n=1 Tax=Pseudomonas endophytica TaxID=1563157 RepID=A0A0Q0SN87_9PSED|nr:hypothetical protein [Pseudomonas endophytica]KQB53102.1 hypothetical protein AQS70_02665 [Pseudomonas endophytica]